MTRKKRTTQEFKAKISELVGALNERNSQIREMPTRQTKYDSLILGDGPNGTYSMDPQKSSVNNNVLVIAGTGGGKTKSVVEANLLHAEHKSMAVLLTKRRLIDQYTPLLKKRGYDVKVLDLVHPDKSTIGYDPILHLKSETDIVGLSKALVMSSGSTSLKEPYWENAAADLFVAFVKLAQHVYGAHARMADVLDSIQRIDFSLSPDEDEEGTSYEDTIAGIPFIQLPPGEQFEMLRDKDPQMYMSWNQYQNNASNTIHMPRRRGNPDSQMLEPLPPEGKMYVLADAPGHCQIP